MLLQDVQANILSPGGGAPGPGGQTRWPGGTAADSQLSMVEYDDDDDDDDDVDDDDGRVEMCN